MALLRKKGEIKEHKKGLVVPTQKSSKEINKQPKNQATSNQ